MHRQDDTFASLLASDRSMRTIRESFNNFKINSVMTEFYSIQSLICLHSFVGISMIERPPLFKP